MINQPSSVAKIPPFIQPLTQLERFSTVSKLTTKIKDLNNSPKHTFLGPLAARIMGVALITFAIITDFVVHLALAIGKAATVPFAQPFRCCIKAFPRDLHLSSPIIHLVQSIRTLSYIAIFLPVLCFLDPDRAYQITRIAGDIEDEINYLKAQKEVLENANERSQEDFVRQQERIDELERERTRLEGSQSNRRDLVEQMTAENNQLKLQIAKSEDEVKKFKEQVQTSDLRLDQLVKDKATLEGKVTTLKDSLSSDQKKLIENHDQQLAQLNDRIKKLTEEKSKIESDVSGKNQENEANLRKLNDEKLALVQQRDQLQAEKDKALGEKATALKEHEEVLQKAEQEIVSLNAEKRQLSSRSNIASQTMQGWKDKFDAQSKKLQEIEGANKKLEQDLTRIKKEYGQAVALQARVVQLEQELLQKNAELDTLKRQQAVEIKEALQPEPSTVLSSASVIHGITGNVIPPSLVEDLPSPIIQELESESVKLEQSIAAASELGQIDNKENDAKSFATELEDLDKTFKKFLAELERKAIRMKSLDENESQPRAKKISEYIKTVQSLVDKNQYPRATLIVREIKEFIEKAEQALDAGSLDALIDADFQVLSSDSIRLVDPSSGSFAREILMRIAEHKLYLEAMKAGVEKMRIQKEHGKIHPCFVTLIYQISWKDPFKVKGNVLHFDGKPVDLAFLNEFVVKISNNQLSNFDQLILKSEEWKPKLIGKGQEFKVDEQYLEAAKTAASTIQNAEYKMLVMVFSKFETHLKPLQDLLLTPEKIKELSVATDTGVKKSTLAVQFFPKMREKLIGQLANDNKSLSKGAIESSVAKIENFEQLIKLIEQEKESIYKNGYVSNFDNTQLKFFVRHLNQFGFQPPR